MKMNKKLLITLPVVAGVLALGTGAGVAYAKSNEQKAILTPAANYATAPLANSPDSANRVGYCGGFVGMMGLGAGGGVVTSQMAALLGTTTTDLQAQLNSGKTVAELAAAKGVSHDQLIQTILAPFNDQMALMLKYNYLTQDQIDSMTQYMKDRLQALITSPLNSADQDAWDFMGNMMRGFSSNSQTQPGAGAVPGTGTMGGYNANSQTQPGAAVAPGRGMMGGVGFGGMMGSR